MIEQIYDGVTFTTFCWYHSLMDIVFVRDLRIETVIGIYDWEREIKQTVILDLEMNTDVSSAAASDRIEDALDYKAVTKRLTSFVEKSKFQLVETLAERCAQVIIEEFDVHWVKLTINKIGALSAARDVGVIIERGDKINVPVVSNYAERG